MKNVAVVGNNKKPKFFESVLKQEGIESDIHYLYNSIIAPYLQIEHLLNKSPSNQGNDYGNAEFLKV